MKSGKNGEKKRKSSPCPNFRFAQKFKPDKKIAGKGIVLIGTRPKWKMVTRKTAAGEVKERQITGSVDTYTSPGEIISCRLGHSTGQNEGWVDPAKMKRGCGMRTRLLKTASKDNRRATK